MLCLQIQQVNLLRVTQPWRNNYSFYSRNLKHQAYFRSNNFAGQPAHCLLLRILTKPNPQEDPEIITISRLRKAACRLIGQKLSSCLQPYFSDAKTLQWCLNYSKHAYATVIKLRIWPSSKQCTFVFGVPGNCCWQLRFEGILLIHFSRYVIS